MLSSDVSYETLLDKINDGVLIADRNGRITYWNAGAHRLCGYQREEIAGQLCTPPFLGHLGVTGLPVFGEGGPLLECLRDGRIREQELSIRHKDGRLIPVFTRVSPITNSLDEVIGVMEVFTDNTSQAAAMRRIRELEELALICPVAQVGNRRYAEMALSNAFEELRRYDWAFGVLFVDIDDFKGVNDREGHQAGDEVLRMVALAIKSTLRSFDFVGRWGGEEFLIVLPNINGGILTRVAERCRAVVEESRFQFEDRTVRVTVSVGATLAHRGESPTQLVERADLLMYESKNKGRNRVTTDV